MTINVYTLFGCSENGGNNSFDGSFDVEAIGNTCEPCITVQPNEIALEVAAPPQSLTDAFAATDKD